MLAERSFHFSWKVSLIGVILIFGMLRLSYWQWSRYLAKEAFLEELSLRIEQPVVPLKKLLEELNEASELSPSHPLLENLLHRRVVVSGTFDFEHEMVKRNRRDESDGPGVHVLTPLHEESLNKHILVNRGYLPLSVQAKEARKEFQREQSQSFIALVKISETPRTVISPIDPPTGKEKKWVDAWLRADIEKIEKQLPYELLPVHLELISSVDDVNQLSKEEIEKAVVSNSNARNEIFYLSDNMNKVSTGELNPNRNYPVPAFSTVVPSATHLLYVFEWGFMALLTFLICLGLQFRKRSQRTLD